MYLIRRVLFLLLFGVIVSGPAEAEIQLLTVTSLTVKPASIAAGQTVIFTAAITATRNLSNYPVRFSWFPVGSSPSTANSAVVNATLPANKAVTETYIGTIPAGTAAGSYTLRVLSASTTFNITSATPAAVNGVCGSVNGTDLTSAPTTSLCSAGAASAVTGAGPWTWTCAGSNGGVTASCDALVAAAPAGGLPVLIQHVASSANPVGVGIPGSNYKIPLPNPVLAGDALVLGITYPTAGGQRSPTRWDRLGPLLQSRKTAEAATT
jgi:hypothetical protein